MSGEKGIIQRGYIMSRIITIILLVLASFCASAEGINNFDGEKLNADISRKLDIFQCVLAAKTHAQKVVCVDGASKQKTSGVVAVKAASVPGVGKKHWTKIGANPEYANFSKFAKQAKQMAVADFGRHIQSRLKQMRVQGADFDRVFNSIFYRKLTQYKLVSEDEKREQASRDVKLMMTGTMRILGKDNGIHPGDELLFLTERNRVRENVIADVSLTEGTIYGYMLSDGRELLDILNCGNLAIRGSTPPPEIPADIVPSKLEPPSKPPIQALPKEQKRYLMDFDLFGFFGEDHGARSDVRFYGGEGAVYPIILDHGDSKDEIGAGGFINACDGTAQGGFHFDCNQWGVGPAFKHMSNNGWDASIKPTFGELVENGRSADGKYNSHREIDLVSIGGGVNIYKRQIRGEKWFPETQIFARVGIPTDVGVSHSYMGKNISDVKELKKFDALINFGVRQIVYDGKYVRPYAELGYFAELPTGQSLRAQIGISDHWKTVFCSLGPNFDLLHGGESLIWSCGVDVSNVIRLGVGKVRQDQFRKTLKNYDEETGGFTMMEDDVDRKSSGYLDTQMNINPSFAGQAPKQ